MPGLVLLGAQWGDEGKGKVTDYLSEKADYIVRYQGGNNAGHTVVVNGEVFKLRLIPSGIISGHAISVIANGVVVDPEVLLSELAMLKEKNVDISKLRISDRAHVIMPYHKYIDELEELAKGEDKIGTTKNGIGPCYMDKCARVGIRIGDLLDETTLKKRLASVVESKNLLLTKRYEAKEVDFEEIYQSYLAYGKALAPYVCDTSLLLYEALEEGKQVVFEGAQGTLLDLDHGTYPFVTSSNPISCSAGVGAGVGPKYFTEVLGIIKSYTTRVGAGPFPTELEDGVGLHLQKVGHEFGTVTGRTRRCGWLDLAVVNYAIRLSGLTSLALMKLDVLDDLEEIKLCVAYRLNGEVIKHFPASLDDLEKCEPIYEILKGWQKCTSEVRKFEDLPVEAQNYIKRIETLTKVPVKMIAVGPGREETILREALI